MHINGGHKNNNDNNITLIFVGLNKTMQKHRRFRKKVKQGKIKRDVLMKMYFNK
jgi:hypothetical protein